MLISTDTLPAGAEVVCSVTVGAAVTVRIPETFDNPSQKPPPPALYPP